MAKQKSETIKAQAIEKEAGKKSSPIKAILIFFFSLVFLLLLFLALLRFNVLGLGSQLAPMMRPLPLSDFYLPSKTETGEIEIDPETGEPILPEEPMITMEELEENLKMAEENLKKKEEEADTLLKQIQSLKAENERLAVFEANQINFQKEKAEWDKEIVATGKPADFVAWYQKISPDNAAKLYQDLAVSVAEQKELDELIKVYTQMKPKAAAKVLENMGNARLEMVAMIIKNLDPDQAGKIMSEMEEKMAARVTAYLYPER